MVRVSDATTYPLSLPIRAPMRFHIGMTRMAGPTTQTNSSVRRVVVVQHVVGEVLHAGEHRGDPGGLGHEARHQHPERPVLRGHPQLGPQRLLALDHDARSAASRVRTKTVIVPTIMMSAMKMPMRPVPGDAARRTRVDHDRAPPRRRPGSSGPGRPPARSSCGCARRTGRSARRPRSCRPASRRTGTWKNANAVAVARNATQTQSAPAPPVNTPAKIDGEQDGQREAAEEQVRPAGAPPGPGAVRQPPGDRIDHDVPGLRGRAPAGRPRPAATPSVSVRYGSSSRPGTVPNAPVTSEPVAYPIRTRGSTGVRAHRSPDVSAAGRGDPAGPANGRHGRGC